jgi:hypothetical protein
MGGEDDSVAFSCSSVTYTFTGFPSTKGNAVSEFVQLDGVLVATPTFSFDGPTGSNAVSIIVPPGRHRMDARAHWNTNGIKGGRDRKLPGGITCKPEPGFTIEKLQRLAGSPQPFTTSELTAQVGQTVDYEIVIANTGNVALTFSNFEEPWCDQGTLSGGPGGMPVPAHAGSAYVCSHTLGAPDRRVGTYPNSVSITGNSPEGGDPHTRKVSNTVIVKLPPEPPLLPHRLLALRRLHRLCHRAPCPCFRSQLCSRQSVARLPRTRARTCTARRRR